MVLLVQSYLGKKMSNHGGAEAKNLDLTGGAKTD